MIIYHYAHLSDWSKIKTQPVGLSGEVGLAPKRRVGREHDEAFNTRAGFALFEAMPEDWVNNKSFEDIFNRLKGNIGELLLEVEVDPEDEDIFVIDRGYLEGYLYDDKTKIPNHYRQDNRRDAEKAYMQSKVSLKKYLEEKDNLNFSLPEIIFQRTIPVDRIRVSDFQPGLKELLDSTRGEVQEDFIREIRKIPELAGWYEKYNRDKEVSAEVVAASHPRIPFR